MINTVQTMIPQQDGSDRYVIIEPVLIKDSVGAWGTNGEYKIYKDAFGDETRLFTEPLERDAPWDELPDEQNRITWAGSSLKTERSAILKATC